MDHPSCSSGGANAASGAAAQMTGATHIAGATHMPGATHIASAGATPSSHHQKSKPEFKLEIGDNLGFEGDAAAAAALTSSSPSLGSKPKSKEDDQEGSEGSCCGATGRSEASSVGRQAGRPEGTEYKDNKGKVEICLYISISLYSVSQKMSLSYSVII